MTRVFLSIILTLATCGSVSAQMGASLVPPSAATDTAKQSGSWQDASTWTDGTVPTVADRVFIPVGLTVTNHATAEALWIHAAGKLACCDHCDTQMNVHTIYVPMGGAFRLGMPGMPATGNVVLEFQLGEFLPGDMTKLSRGIINHGEFTICGNEKTASDIIDGDLPIGATSLKLANVPFGWKVGDRIAIAGTDSPLGGVRYQTEERTITAVNGRTVSWSEPLLYRHFRWRSDLPFHCANESRNIVIRSRDPGTIANRGHLMSMSAGMNLFYCRTEGLGRTDKSQPVTDPRNDLYGEFVPGSDANPRARYAIHWHRAGALSPPAFCRGVVVDGSPGWGILNHNSNVQVDDCLAMRCFGFGMGTEEGQERGHFRRCLSFLNRGLGDTITSTDDDHGRPHLGDWGMDGSGFWLQGGLVQASDCVAFDNSGRGFALFDRPLNGYPRWYYQLQDHIKYPITIDGLLLSEEYAGVASVPSGSVPQRVFDRNTAYGNKVGVQGWSGHTDTWPVAVRGSITNLTLWGRGTKLHLEYMRQLNVDGLKMVGDNAWRIEPLSNSINRESHAVVLRGAEVTVRNWSIENITARMVKFRVGGHNDPGGIAVKNLAIEGATINADGSVSIP